MTADSGQTRPDAEDIVVVLKDQHRRVTALFDAVATSTGATRKRTFAELRQLLAVHETAEEMILRPTTRKAAGNQVAADRDAEEKAATRTLADLERLDPASEAFDVTLAGLRTAVLAHAEREETLEFPAVEAEISPEQRRRLGRALLAVESLAPTHPHPRTAGSTAAQYVVGPFASLLDHARDAISSAISR
jgi:hemerythrin superfamily protein